MKRAFTSMLATLPGLLAFALLSASVHAQDEGNTYVYTNNNDAANTVTGFKVQSTGALTKVRPLPFMTGGSGQNALGPFYASHRIIVSRKFLYASNDGNSTISTFKIDPGTGFLSQPAPLNLSVSTGSSTLGGQGISLAATRDAKYLYAADAGSCTISTFSIAGNGALTLIDRKSVV